MQADCTRQCNRENGCSTVTAVGCSPDHAKTPAYGPFSTGSAADCRLCSNLYKVPCSCLLLSFQQIMLSQKHRRFTLSCFENAIPLQPCLRNQNVKTECTCTGHTKQRISPCLDAVSLVTFLPGLRSTTLLASCSTRSTWPAAAAAAVQTCDTAPGSAAAELALLWHALLHS